MTAWNLRKHLHDRWLLLLLAIGSIAIAYVFAKVGSEVHEGKLAGVDRTVRELVFQRRASAAVAFFSAMTLLGGKYLLVPIGVVAGWFLSGRSKVFVVLVVLCGIVSSEFVDLLKSGFSAVRPPTGLAERQSSSFPSGHVSGTTAVAILLCFVSVRRRVATLATIAVSTILVVLMSVSRVYLDMHWISDVLGGLLIGVTLGLGFSALYEWIYSRALSPDIQAQKQRSIHSRPDT